MSEITLYQQILGLTPPWQVRSVKLDEMRQRIVVEIICSSTESLRCPHCAKDAGRYDSRWREWRHLDTCQYQTVIKAQVPRVQCDEHGCLTLPVPWAEPGSRYTECFENRIINLLSMASIHAVSRTFRLSWGAIDRIMAKAVERGLARRGEVCTEHLLLDETSFKKGHDYVTLLSNRQGQVLAVADGRSGESVRACFAKLSNVGLAGVKTLCMDMSAAYLRAAKQLLPNAHKQIAFDHFHVAQLLTQAVNHIRKDELLRLNADMRREAHLTRYYWLKNRTHLPADQKARLEKLVSSLQGTALAWYLKEKARDIWHGHRVKGAKRRWQDWIDLVNVCELKPMTTAAQTIKERLWGILNAMRHRASNALAEAINGKIRQLKVRAMGYRNKERFKKAILFHFGGLELAH